MMTAEKRNMSNCLTTKILERPYFKVLNLTSAIKFTSLGLIFLFVLFYAPLKALFQKLYNSRDCGEG